MEWDDTRSTRNYRYLTRPVRDWINMRGSVTCTSQSKFRIYFNKKFRIESAFSDNAASIDPVPLLDLGECPKKISKYLDRMSGPSGRRLLVIV